MSPPSPYPPIADYAVIGDGRTAALVSRQGSIDWLCLPRFDADPVFSRILDAALGGYWAILPHDIQGVQRAYRERTNVLETHFTTATGRLRVTDFFPALTETQKRYYPLPQTLLVRRARCETGRVAFDVTVRLRPGFGRRTPELRRFANHWYQYGWGHSAAVLYASVPLEQRGSLLRATVVLQAGEAADFALAYADEAPIELPLPQLFDTLERLTIEYWSRWISHCTYSGPYREAVERSALVLKLLTYAPSGAIVAAPTTSLPEWPGGPRNWDYRYCWLRDAAFTVRALLGLGCHEEAEAFVDWILYATRLTQPELQVVYTIYGDPRIPERELVDLDGYRSSRPVRIGNGASSQFQLDVYGEVIDAFARYRAFGRPLDADEYRFLRGLADVIVCRWREPDDGIWEVRSGRAHHVHSKVMVLVGLRHLERLARLDRVRLPLDRYRQTAAELERWLVTYGVDPARNAFVAVPGGEPDASLLWLALQDVFLSPAHPWVQGTVDAVLRELTAGDLVYRYHRPDGLAGPEGAFVICSCWLVEALARIGRLDEAHERFERLLQRANDVGLFAEEIDPRTGEHLGNFPQAFSHIGLVSAALALAEAAEPRRTSALGAG
ncbi:MAG: glycoside hydrolase family 15 protein [Thermomicrobium sp.]|nr:glycoside hydrolase family 15 protein [Thermomicrobium sp.]